MFDDEEQALLQPTPVLNYSQHRIVVLRKNFILNLSATNVVMELMAEPQFDVKELRTGRVLTLENRLLCGYGGDVS